MLADRRMKKASEMIDGTQKDSQETLNELHDSLNSEIEELLTEQMLKDLEGYVEIEGDLGDEEIDVVYETEEEMRARNKSEFRKKLETLINCHCLENSSNTPDFILADYLMDCLNAFDKAVSIRSKWWDHEEWDAINETLKE